ALAETGAALHPALRLVTEPPVLPSRSAVLFVCTGNSARSPIAETLLRHHTGGRVTTISAGSRPKAALHPHAVQVLRRRYGLDITDQRPRHLDTLHGRRFDHVITLCDKAREVCPEFGYDSRRIHWSIPDPAAAQEPEAAFAKTAADIDTRVRHLLPVLAHTPEARS
ncbi:arsenate reductase ArsC, partial [Spirillospora sp. CA-253888]